MGSQNVNTSGIERNDPILGCLLTMQHHHQLKHQWKVETAVTSKTKTTNIHFHHYHRSTDLIEIPMTRSDWQDPPKIGLKSRPKKWPCQRQCYTTLVLRKNVWHNILKKPIICNYTILFQDILTCSTDAQS